jgi:aminopeptidase N
VAGGSVGALLFYMLYHVIGAEAFDGAYRDFFQRYRSAGGTSAQLVQAFTRADPRAEAVFGDWFLTTRWRDRLGAGESTRGMLEGYTRR